jgi:hypothetical protein
VANLDLAADADRLDLAIILTLRFAIDPCEALLNRVHAEPPEVQIGNALAICVEVGVEPSRPFRPRWCVT